MGPENSADKLTQHFKGCESVSFRELASGLVVAEISNKSARATVSLYGGQVLSYTPDSTDQDLLFVSGKAYFETGKAIKGGIPICWPWFGSPSDGRQAHGFVRNQAWRLSLLREDDGETTLQLVFEQPAATRDDWPFAANVQLTITVGKSLGLQLHTRNMGDVPFALTQALHSYFNVSDVRQVSLSGFDNMAYIDTLDAWVSKQQVGDIRIDQEVDRIYQAGAGQQGALQTITDPGLQRVVSIQPFGSASTVVWNPWIDKARAMADFADDEYQRMVCIETANAGQDVIQLAPGDSHELGVRYALGGL